jgi:predicted MPP superfamily phosphohydrolase
VKPERRPYSRTLYVAEHVMRRLYFGGWPATLWALLPGRTRVHLIEHELDLGRPPGRPPLRIAFASDLHIGPTTPPEVLDNAFAHLAEARPDVLALGGDYVFLGALHDRVAELKRRVAAVPAPLKVAVLGNHDFWARPERIADALADIGVQVLINRPLRLPPPHDDIALVGLDDPVTGRVAAEAVAQVVDVPRKIALCHSPDAIYALRNTDASLLLCGHTHGGAVCLPGYRPIVMPSHAGRLYPYGRHQLNGLTLFVSRGVGGSLIPVRTWAPPDVVVFTIR